MDQPLERELRVKVKRSYKLLVSDVFSKGDLTDHRQLGIGCTSTPNDAIATHAEKRKGSR